MTFTVNCPYCARPVPWTEESRWRPFCSERCRLIDMGAWLNEEHRISDDAGTSSRAALGSKEKNTDS